ncbi:hypothetical protein TMatcc_001752 [Talaromyces marneffei ATCC 18224]|nr:uncharacterized protein EYB26_007045 [Talaromyces marneffei]QGA19356.1 hypothetical protein EYB26_007045 [Talaromyces marneffei]
MPSIPPRESPVPQEAQEEPSTPEDQILTAFYANAPPDLIGLEIKCRMYVTWDKSGPLEYDMYVSIDKTVRPLGGLQILGALRSVEVSYYTERSVTENGVTPIAVSRHALEFVNGNQMETRFHADMHEVRWDQFLIIGVEFPANTVHYNSEIINFNQGQYGITRRTIETMQKLHLRTTRDRDPIRGRADNSIYAQTLFSHAGLFSGSESSSRTGSVETGEIQWPPEPESSHSEA